jgi:curli production assembly/transport component CsgF
MSNRYWIITACALLGLSAAPAVASEMVYHPVNPTFGGNPLNGSFLLSTAQAQGEGVKSGSQGPDLSSLANALSNPEIVIGGTGSGGTTGSNGATGTGGTNGSNGTARTNGTMRTNSVMTP